MRNAPKKSSPQTLLSPQLKQALGYRKFKRDQLTVLLLDGAYHLHDECRQALTRLGHRVLSVPVGEDVAAVVQGLLLGLLQGKPDFVLSINHIGFDEAGKIGALLDELQIPIAVWYVDSPLFVLRRSELPAADWTTLFLWERTLVQPMLQRGAREAHFLPLATDPAKFAPRTVPPHRPALTQALSFVGDSMTSARKKWDQRLSKKGRRQAKALAATLLADRSFSPLTIGNQATGSLSRHKCDQVAAATWQATARYRRSLIEPLADSQLHLFGDEGWIGQLPEAHYRGPVNYGPDLAAVYESSAINLNMTSLQMPTAVNQRVFDVPAAGGFVLTDAQSDLFEHFVAGQEVIAFENPEQLQELVCYYREHETERRRIVQRAQRRVLLEHTYEHRLTTMLQLLRRRHGGIVATTGRTVRLGDKTQQLGVL